MGGRLRWRGLFRLLGGRLFGLLGRLGLRSGLGGRLRLRGLFRLLGGGLFGRRGLRSGLSGHLHLRGLFGLLGGGRRGLLGRLGLRSGLGSRLRLRSLFGLWRGGRRGLLGRFFGFDGGRGDFAGLDFGDFASFENFDDPPGLASGERAAFLDQHAVAVAAVVGFVVSQVALAPAHGLFVERVPHGALNADDDGFVRGVGDGEPDSLFAGHALVVLVGFRGGF